MSKAFWDAFAIAIIAMLMIAACAAAGGNL